LNAHDLLFPHDLGPGFYEVMERTFVPVLVKNGDGLYIFANAAAEQLLGYGRGQLGGKYIQDISADDPVWLLSEFERFKAEGAWTGILRFHRQDGSIVSACLNAFTATSSAGDNAYIALLRRAGGGESATPALQRRSPSIGEPITSVERGLLQLLAAGFTDRDLASILGRTEWAVTRDVLILMQKLRVRSRTAACIVAIKVHLIA
jgi:PAS domain S-box-containing protein